MAKTSIPVYDIYTIDRRSQTDILIERFGGYLEKHYQHLHQQNNW
jgi:AraC family transcriptional regulator, transcriptional activator of pobA